MPQGKDVQAQDSNEQEEEITSVEETQEQNSEEIESEAEPQEETDEPSTDTEEDSGDESSKPESPKERPIFTMPVAKANKAKEKAIEKAREQAKAEAKAEYEAKIESMKQDYESRLTQGQSTASLDAELKQFAEENGVNADIAKGLLGIFKKSIQVPDTSRYDQLVQEQEIEKFKTQVSHEFDDQVIPLIKRDYPSATASHINKVKKEIEALAFSKRFNTYPVTDIYEVNRKQFEFKNSYTGEDSGGRTTSTDSLANLTEAEAMKLSPEKYVAWQDLQASKQSSYVDL